jgi:hypothetical protein
MGQAKFDTTHLLLVIRLPLNILVSQPIFFENEPGVLVARQN